MIGVAHNEGLAKEGARRKRWKPTDPIKQRDYELWKKWNDGGRKPEDLRPLMTNFRNFIRKRANFWASRVDLPPATVHAEFNKQFLKACETYNPEKGASLGTHSGYYLKKAQRWINACQDPTRTQETRYYQMGNYQNVKATLDDQLGREPTTEEVASQLGWSPAEVERIEKESRGAYYAGVSEGYDPTTVAPSRESEILRFIVPELTREEKLVREYTIGEGGKPKLTPGEIARKLNMNPSRVSRIRKSIIKKMEKYL